MMRNAISKSISAGILAFFLLLTACGSNSSGTESSASPPNAASPSPTTAAAEPQSTLGPPDKVNFAYFPAFHTMVVFVADKGGFFTEQNLDVNMIYTDKGSLLPTLLISGDADISTVDITSIANAQAQGKELLHLFPTSQNMSMNFVADNSFLAANGVTADSPLEDRLAVLGKMKIGITGPASPTDIYTRFLLTKAGYNPDDISLITLTNAGNLLAALKSRQIDGFMLTPPTPNQPELEGYGTIIVKSSAGEIAELANYPYQGITVMKAWAEEHPDTAARFVKALLQASDFIRANPEEAKGLLKEYFPDMDDAALEAGMNDMIPSLPVDGLLTEDFVSKYLTLNKEIGILDLPELPSAAEGVLWTNEFVKKAGE
ncbi:ABC transporter substrate-binding protein [Paenibacillus sp. S150]|uniref:ABC transporter substrate-binding protein n=1 Tax=Paenibacillus sp. S150 TaxID=2749826 RepID=UPI001C58E219|nr:ABC transporter substrate-binding protein [Paenibacillus sp. S150]MBW4081998.1 ABC transporter substrate-binding protein [Paenibacillus sp. S150]